MKKNITVVSPNQIELIFVNNFAGNNIKIAYIIYFAFNFEQKYRMLGTLDIIQLQLPNPI